MMADIFLFMRQGWKNIWKQNTVWLFSALYIFTPLFRVFQIKYELDSRLPLLYQAGSFLSVVLAFIGFIGVPYLVYCFAIGRAATIKETLSAVQKFSGRVIGCSCLVLLILSPCLFAVIALSLNNSTQPPHLSNRAFLLFLPLSLFGAMAEFSMFEFFAKDSGIRQSLKEAWTLFTAHFGVLATLGITMIIIDRIYSAISGLLTSLIQSGFSVASLSKLNDNGQLEVILSVAQDAILRYVTYHNTTINLIILIHSRP